MLEKKIKESNQKVEKSCNLLNKVKNKLNYNKDETKLSSLLDKVVSSCDIKVIETEKHNKHNRQLKLPTEPTYNNMYVPRMSEDYDRKTSNIFGISCLKRKMMLRKKQWLAEPTTTHYNLQNITIYKMDKKLLKDNQKVEKSCNLLNKVKNKLNYNKDETKRKPSEQSLGNILSNSYNIDELEKRVYEDISKQSKYDKPKRQKKLSTEPTYNSIYTTNMSVYYSHKCAIVFGVIKQHMLICGDYRLTDKAGKLWCPLSAKLMAKKINRSISYVEKAIKELRNEGLVKTKLKHIRKGKRVNYFCITQQEGANWLTTWERKKLNLSYEWENKEEIIQEEIIKRTEEIKILNAEKRTLQKSEPVKYTDINIRNKRIHIENFNEKEEEKEREIESPQLITEPIQKIETFSKEELIKICKNWSKNQIIGLAVNQSRVIDWLYDCNGRQIKANDNLSVVNGDVMTENSQLRWQSIGLKKFIKKKNWKHEETIGITKTNDFKSSYSEEELLDTVKMKLASINSGATTLEDWGLDEKGLGRLKSFVKRQETKSNKRISNDNRKHTKERPFEKSEILLTPEEKLKVRKFKLKLIDENLRTPAELGLSFDDVDEMRKSVETNQ